MIAALYVETGGVYFGLEGVEPWDLTRDARLYAGPHRVVAHPPCQRWGRYWSGGPSAKVKRVKGDDGGCFEDALRAARAYGGVIEHPEASHAYAHFGLPRPPKAGQWIPGALPGEWACCVEQGHYGHRARKATWLYLTHSPTRPPPLIWGPSQGERLDEGFHSKAERAAARAEGRAPVKRLSTRENLATPTAFRDLLLALAGGVLVSDTGNTHAHFHPTPPALVSPNSFNPVKRNLIGPEWCSNSSPASLTAWRLHDT